MRWVVLFLFAAFAAKAGPVDGVSADVFILGEIHDNPAHHLVQAEAIAAISPAAVVFEMLTEDQAARVTDDLRADPVALGEVLEWQAGGWPDFAIYYPVFEAADAARLYGAAVPRERTRTAMQIGIARAFGAEAELYGLADELEADELADRLNLQLAAHCGAMPLDILPDMVDVQRLRDAVLARAALLALVETGGPVVVITGNGHARRDWGVPSYLARVAPDATVFVLGQSEAGRVPEGGFDRIVDADPVAREDPCAGLE